MGNIKCICVVCSKEFFVFPCDIKQGKGKNCSMKCRNKWMRLNPNKGTFKQGFKHSLSTIEKFKERIGESNPSWKGGKDIIQKNGYITSYCPVHPHRNYKNRMYKHRLVMEEHIGRYLSPTEIVHHINGNKTDNRIENLKLCKDHADHTINHKRDKNGRFVKSI